MGKPQPWETGFGVSCNGMILPYHLHQHRPTLSLGSYTVLTLSISLWLIVAGLTVVIY